MAGKHSFNWHERWTCQPLRIRGHSVTNIQNEPHLQSVLSVVPSPTGSRSPDRGVCLVFGEALAEGELYGVQQAVFILWFIVSLGAVLASQNTWIWIAGFLAQVGLAIVLVLKHRIDNIY
jgi:hypothetical protein